MVKRLCLTSFGLMLLLAGCGTGGGATDDSTVGAMPGLEAPDNATAATTTASGLEPAVDSAGIAATATPSGTIDRTNSFFQRLGTNARTCETCHGSNQGWSLTPLRAPPIAPSAQASSPRVTTWASRRSQKASRRRRSTTCCRNWVALPDRGVSGAGLRTRIAPGVAGRGWIAPPAPSSPT